MAGRVDGGRVRFLYNVSMALITWTKEQFGTSVSVHDQEHQALFEHLNNLDSTIGGGDRAAIGAALDSLIDVVARHFASEEANMAKTGFSGLAAHKEQHDKLVATCVDLQKKFRAGEADLTPETTAFVRDWLYSHIPNIDRAYGPHMNSKGIA